MSRADDRTWDEIEVCRHARLAIMPNGFWYCRDCGNDRLTIIGRVE